MLELRSLDRDSRCVISDSIFESEVSMAVCWAERPGREEVV